MKREEKALLVDSLKNGLASSSCVALLHYRGLTDKQLYDFRVALKNKKIKAADIVELNPMFDNGATASLAARMISIIIAMNLKLGN